MTLCEYLNKYFSSGEAGEFEKLPVDLTIHFLDKFGVDVKKENDLYLLKYNMISANFSFPITHECRGIILRYDGKWEVVSRPYSKFFNWTQSMVAITEKDFAPNLQISEKIDGSLIQIWKDEKLNKWRVSTSDTITSMAYDQAWRPNDTFENLFLKTIKILNFDRLDSNFTYIFELATMDNRVVTKYPEDTVYLIAAREKKYGLYKTDQEVDDLCLQLMEDGSNVKRPQLKFLYELNLNSFSEVVAWVEKESQDPKYGEFPEGFVIYRGGIPVAKMKNSKYLAAFHVSGGNKGHAKNTIISLVFEEKLDDVYSMMIPELQEFANKIKEKVAAMGKEIIEAGREIGKEKYETQKDYAMAVQSKCHNKMLHAFFFTNKLQILSGANINELYTQWIKENYKRFLDLWKEKD